jgi:hypothetical protein
MTLHPEAAIILVLLVACANVAGCAAGAWAHAVRDRAAFGAPGRTWIPSPTADQASCSRSVAACFDSWWPGRHSTLWRRILRPAAWRLRMSR